MTDPKPNAESPGTAAEPPRTPLCLRPAGAARRAGRSPRTIGHWLRLGRVRECGTPGCRNVPAASLEAFLAAPQRVPALKGPLFRRRGRWAACYDPVPLVLRIRKAGLSKQQAAADARMHRPTVTRVLDGRGTR